MGIENLNPKRDIQYSMLKESAMKKWFKFEMAKINSGIVINKRSLKDLLEEEVPQTKAKDESVYYFNKDALLELKNESPKDMHSIMLPINFYISLDTRSNVYIADKPALSVLKYIGEVPHDAELVDGRYWMSKALILDLMKKRPSIIQLIRY
jgi:uncharacterized protein (UPF0216 family)